MKKESVVKEGVKEAWDCWLADHPVSVPEIIEEAVRKAVVAWLDEHEEDIKERIAKRFNP